MLEIQVSPLEAFQYQSEDEDLCLDFYIKRDDLIHPIVSGNKWRKLKYSIAKAEQNKNEAILTFGGALSNHLVATAAACKEVSLKSIGYVRGEELNQDSNPTLQQCADLGMELHFISREEYNLKSEKFYTDELHVEHPNVYIVPEGGASYYGIIGCSEIIGELPEDVSDIFVSAGTGTTAAGLLMGSRSGQTIHIVSALKGEWMEEEVKKLLMYSLFDEEAVDELMQRAHFIYDAHCGGYAKTTPELVEFTQNVYQQTDLKLDPVYTGKSMLWIKQNWKQCSPTGRLVFIHTGGVQGSIFMQEKLGVNLYPRK